MFESPRKLAEDISGLLDAIRREAGGRYACLVEPGRILFESPEADERESRHLRRLLEERGEALFAIPKRMASGEEMEDVFDGWEHDDLFLAFLNERVALVLACPDAEPLRERLLPPLKALADRLFRWNSAYRMDRQGRGFFFGGGKLDLVVVGRGERR